MVKIYNNSFKQCTLVLKTKMHILMNISKKISYLFEMVLLKILTITSFIGCFQGCLKHFKMIIYCVFEISDDNHNMYPIEYLDFLDFLG